MHVRVSEALSVPVWSVWYDQCLIVPGNGILTLHLSTLPMPLLLRIGLQLT